MKCKKILASLLSLGLVFSPMSIFAEDTAVAQSADGTSQYNDYDSAWSAANNGVEIVMLQDWNLSSRLIVNESATVTIDMNGHKMDRNLSDSVSDGEVIYLKKKSNLTLKGSTDSTFTVKNLWKDKDGGTTTQETIGGLVTGGYSSNGGGGIHMKEGSQLTLDHVGVMGNSATTYSRNGGGIHTDGDGCIINLNNESSVSYNYASNKGGGIYVDDEDNYIYMDNSEISYNRANEGGGIASNDDATRITMNNLSKINNNRATEAGGAIYFGDSYSLVQSPDSTGSINNNVAAKDGVGGAIYYPYVYTSNHQAEIKNIDFTNNQAQSYDEVKYNSDGDEIQNYSRGGAIYSNIKNLTITNCAFTGNTAEIGGAIYQNATNMTLDNCTITNNKSTDKGAGVYVNSSADINLTGDITIKDNTNNDSASDIYLDSDSARAYVSGTPNAGSKVGLLGIGEGKVAINQSENNGCFFLDESDRYHLEYSGSEIYEKSGATGSIFGNGNTVVALCVMGGIVVVGAVVLVVNKKKKANA